MNYCKFTQDSIPEFCKVLLMPGVFRHMIEINFSIVPCFKNLPVEDMYSPPINIRVKDNRAFGRKPLVGIHSVKSLGPFKCKLSSQKTADEDSEVDGNLLLSFILICSIRYSCHCCPLLLSINFLPHSQCSSCRSACRFNRCTTPSEKDLAGNNGRCRCPSTGECKRKGKGGKRKEKEND